MNGVMNLKRSNRLSQGLGGVLAGVALLVGGAAWQGAAQAATVSSATISGLTFTLVDLDPNDGITPSLQWSSSYGFAQADRQFGQTVNLIPQGGGLPQWAATFTQAAPTALSESFSFMDALLALQAGASAATGRTGVNAATTAAGGESLSAIGFASGQFVLSAGTELRVSASLNAGVGGPGSAGFQGPAGVDPAFAVPFSQALAYAELFLEGQSALSTTSGQSYTPSTDPLTFGDAAYADDDPQTVDLFFRNETAGDLTGSFYALVQSTAMELAPVDTQAVPLPGSLPLMATALFTLGLGLRSRRR